MSKLTKQEKQKIEQQYKTNHRDTTWIGIRPTVIEDKKHKEWDKLSDRQTMDKLLQEYQNEQSISFSTSDDIEIGDCKNIDGITLNGKTLETYNLDNIINDLDDFVK